MVDIQVLGHAMNILFQAGLTDVFNPAKSNLVGILETYEPLYISAAKQKAFCKLDEKGTEAAAANGMYIHKPSDLVEHPVASYRHAHTSSSPPSSKGYLIAIYSFMSHNPDDGWLV